MRRCVGSKSSYRDGFKSTRIVLGKYPVRENEEEAGRTIKPQCVSDPE